MFYMKNKQSTFRGSSAAVISRQKMVCLPLVAFAFAFCAMAGDNLLPDDFVCDNAGGFCGWDTKGAPVADLGRQGPEGRKALRFAGTGRSLCFEVPWFKLAAGGRYRLSADVRTKGLEAAKRIDLLVYNARWKDEERVSVPRDTSGDWKRISREFSLMDSLDGKYAVALYASDAFAKDAYLDISGVMLEPLDEKAKNGSQAAVAEPFKPRISPVDPLLNDVDAAHARLTFFYPGEIESEGERLVLRAKMAGRTVLGEFGKDHKAAVDFGKVAKGYRRIDLAVVGANSGKVFASNGYTLKANEAVKGVTPAKRLNNFVSELFAKPLENGEIPFVIAKEGWVYVSLDKPYPGVTVDVDGIESALRFREGEPSETQRCLAAGRHVLKVKGVDGASKGGMLRVRLVKTIGGANLSVPSEAGRDYLRWGFAQGFYERFAMYATLNTADMKPYGHPRVMRIAERAAERGIKVKFACGLQCRNPARNDIHTLYEAVAANPAFGMGVPMALDENAIDAPPRMKYNYSEAAWLVGERCGDFSIWWEDGFHGMFNRPFLDIPELSAVINSGAGNGEMFTEAYYVTPKDEAGWNKLVDWIKRQRRLMREEVPAAPSRYIYALSGWEYPGIWTTRHHPHVDLKAFYSRLMRLYATDPEFADIGGVSFTTPACDEDLVRFYYDAARHYCLEGRTDDLAENLGYAMFAKHLANGDFDDGLDGWTVSAAETGSVEPGYMKKLGAHSQRRMYYPNGVGDHFAMMKRSAKAPNVLKQKLVGLKPGGLYQISFCSMYYDDMLKPGSVQKKTAGVRVAVAGAEHIDDLDHVVCLRGSKAGEPERAATFVHRIVFRAAAESCEMSITDWLENAAPGGDIGERTAVNYVGCTAYYVRGPEDVKALSEINLATGKGAHP
jgi:hypothetical protein